MVGNPPFGKQSVFDPEHPELNKFSIHNYFIAKSLKSLRDGGIGAFVVSRYFMDAADPTVREHISEYADLLGAVRLPNTAFRQNALTDVTTDILFFRKHSGDRIRSKDWVYTEDVAVDDFKDGGVNTATINRYFALTRDRQIIGKMAYTSGQFGSTLTCVPPSTDFDLGAAISRCLEVLPPETYIPRAPLLQQQEQAALNNAFIASDYFQSLKMGAFCIEPKSGTVVAKCPGALSTESYRPVPIKRDTERLRLTGIIGIRDAVRSLLNAEKTDAPGDAIEAARRGLNTVYDAFVKTYGHLNSQTNRGLMRDDPESALMESLEVGYDKGISAEMAKRQSRAAKPPSAQKAAIFSHRVLKPAQAVTSVDNPKDALVICLRELGRVSFGRMQELTNFSAEDIQKNLQEQRLIFLNPTTETWEIGDKYLAGNVREKLRIAQAAAQKDARFLTNVEALAEAMPKEIEAIDIGIKLGSSWVPKEIFEDFIEHLHGGRGSQTFSYIESLGKWEAKVNIWDIRLQEVSYGIPEYPASKVIESLFKNTPIKVERDTAEVDDNGKPLKQVDQELTAAVMQKAETLKQEFLDWVWQDDKRRESLAGLYNEKFNTHVPPRYDGSHLDLSSATSGIALRPHQKDAVWRAIQEGTALFDHVVGAGKTMACISTIMESRRMGLFSKPMVVVPNHLVYQWRDEFFKLYPDANILVAEKEDFTKQNRERFFARVATGDWDAVVVAHSSFKKVEMPYETQREILEEQIDAVVNAIETSKQTQGGRTSVKQLEKQRDSMRARYEKLMAMGGAKDKGVDFSDLGVDALFVDESQEFKNLGFTTSMNVAGLGNITGSSKALDLYTKCRYLQRKNDGKGVFFLTGTPISNTIAEVYTLQRYLQPDVLASKGIEHFDAWASVFGAVTSGWELDATGINYKLKSRFASFQNVPELLSMVRSFADVVTKNDLDDQARQAGLRPLTPPVQEGGPQNIVVERSPAQAAYMEQIISRMENLPTDPREDNPLKITNDARKAGLDFRLIDPQAEDFAGSKVNAAIDNIHRIWQESTKDKGTQLVFCDLSTPKGKAVAIPDADPLPNSRLEQEEDEDEPLRFDMDDVIAMSSGKFSVYDDVRAKLIAKGIPAEQVAFIHDANTDLRKAKLFKDMQEGNVRILLGSTSKMGAGTNVQKRLVAAHHLDAPWRPSDLEQRNGRIIRQGNILYERDQDFQVNIYNYATKQTYDARMWQTIEYKAAAIDQFRKGDMLQRRVEDVQSEAANAAEMKAAASGNPLILMQVQLASELRKLEALEVQHNREQHRLRDRLRFLEGSKERFAKAQAAHDKNICLRDANTVCVTEKGQERIRIDVVTHEGVLRDSGMIRDVLVSQVKKATKTQGSSMPVGKYRGFELAAMQRPFESDKYRFCVTGADGKEYLPENMVFAFDDKLSVSGLFQRMDNFLDKTLPQQIEQAVATHAREMQELTNINCTHNHAFAQKDELALVRNNHHAVIRELQRMQDEPGYVSTWQPASSLQEAISQTMFQDGLRTLNTTTTAIAKMGAAEHLPLLKNATAANNIHLSLGVERLLLEQEANGQLRDGNPGAQEVMGNFLETSKAVAAVMDGQAYRTSLEAAPARQKESEVPTDAFYEQVKRHCVWLSSRMATEPAIDEKNVLRQRKENLTSAKELYVAMQREALGIKEPKRGLGLNV